MSQLPFQTDEPRTPEEARQRIQAMREGSAFMNQSAFRHANALANQQAGYVSPLLASIEVQLPEAREERIRGLNASLAPIEKLAPADVRRFDDAVDRLARIRTRQRLVRSSMAFHA